jgi:hypothetical protein
MRATPQRCANCGGAPQINETANCKCATNALQPTLVCALRQNNREFLNVLFAWKPPRHTKGIKHPMPAKKRMHVHLTKLYAG